MGRDIHAQKYAHTQMHGTRCCIYNYIIQQATSKPSSLAPTHKNNHPLKHPSTFLGNLHADLFVFPAYTGGLLEAYANH